MTCRERLIKEHPEFVSGDYKGGCRSCPSDYKYMDDPDYCNMNERQCRLCWDREIPEEATPITFDWSKLQEFIDDSMKKRDRSVSVYFHPEMGASVNVYPWPDVEETDNEDPFWYLRKNLKQDSNKEV